MTSKEDAIDRKNDQSSDIGTFVMPKVPPPKELFTHSLDRATGVPPSGLKSGPGSAGMQQQQQPAPMPHSRGPPVGHNRRVHDASQQQTGLASLGRIRQDRRSFSGTAFTNLFFEGRYRTLHELHNHTYMGGFNVIGAPGLPTGAIFRSSLPATPVATPIRAEPMIQFTEQAIHSRLCGHQHQSPRKIDTIFNQTPSKFAHLQSSRAKDLEYNDEIGVEMEINRSLASTPMETDSSSPTNG